MALLVMIVLFGAIYYFMIRPQQRQMKEHQALLRSLEEGDEVVTSGGIHGAIAEIDGDIVWLEVAPDVELKVARAAISQRSDTDDDSELEAAEIDDEA
ncbi:MAG: preprotein translocase subunit YajC [Acidimicrobiales bacterium]